MFLLTITERTPTPPELQDVNTYHIICQDFTEVTSRLDDYFLNFGVLVSATITPFVP